MKAVLTSSYLHYIIYLFILIFISFALPSFFSSVQQFPFLTLFEISPGWLQFPRLFILRLSHLLVLWRYFNDQY